LLEFEVHMVGKVKTKTYKKTPKWKKSQQEPWNVPIFFLKSWIRFKSCAIILYHAHMTRNQKKKILFFLFFNQLLLPIVKYLLQKHFLLLPIMHYIYCFSYFITNKLNLHTQTTLLQGFFTCLVWERFTLCSHVEKK
jgi:hypothetical protein